jgi:hypothetical protein
MLDCINISFGEFSNLKFKIRDLYDDYSESQYNKINKKNDEISLLETSNISSFDLELNYKCHVLVRKILYFLNKKEEIKSNIIEKNNNKNIISNNNDINNYNLEEEIRNESENSNDFSDNILFDEKEDIINGVKNINNIIIKKFQSLSDEIINKLNKEVIDNPNYKKEVKDKFKEYKNHTMQIIGIMNNYEIEHITRIYDSIGCKGRPKLAYNPENITTFDERIEDINVNENDGYEFIPVFNLLKEKN